MTRIGLVGRITWILLAGASLSVAMLILLLVDLPQHRDFTGYYLEGYGYVAPEVGALAPPFYGRLLAGDAISLEALRGTPLLLNFWATWCEPCRVEMPELMAFAEAYPDVRVLAINTGESPEVVRAWLNEHGIALDVIMDVTGTIAQMYRLRGQPMSYLIGANGQIERIFFGAVDSGLLAQAWLSVSSK